MATSPDHPLIPSQDLRAWFGGISKMTEHRLSKSDPDFPTPIRLGGRNFYDPDEVHAYLEAKKQKGAPAGDADNQVETEEAA